MFSDLRFAFRQLSKSPGFTLVAILTLALGIGANTSMFSLLNEVILRPLPYADSEQLDRIYRSTPQDPKGGVSPADYLDLLRAKEGYGELAAFGYGDMNLADPGRPAELAKALRVTPNFFSTLGVQPQLGRNLLADEAQQGNHRVLIISHRCWKNRFGGDTGIIGHIVRIDGVSHEIVGVLPESFNDWRHLGWVDLFRPLGLTETEATDRKSTWLQLIGRHPGTRTRAQSDVFIADFGRRLASDHPEVNAGSSWRAAPLNDVADNPRSKVILVLLVSLSSFVLLIACTNLANLLLARTMERAREFAVRAALGASRSRLLRPLLAESLLLALAGGIGAIIADLWFSDWLRVAGASDNGDTAAHALDWRVLSWTFFISLCTILAFGIAPALFAMRIDINRILKSGSRGTTGGRTTQRLRSILIVGQFALAMIMLSGASLFVRGLDALNNRHYGWESAHLISGTINLPASNYPGNEDITAFHRLALERLEALPGVESAGISYAMPYFGLSDPSKLVVEGRDIPAPGHEPAAAVNGISPHYFATTGTRLLAGRVFNEIDTLTTAKVFIINQAMAKGLFGEENPIGRRISQIGGESREWGEIVGVVGDTHSVDPSPGPITFGLYEPLAQIPRRNTQISIRTNGVAPASLIDGIRRTLAALNPDLPVSDLYPADTHIAKSTHSIGLAGKMLSGLALLGLSLAALGIYGVIARAMAQRRGEFGIRLALGAQLNDITSIVLRAGLKLALIGSGIGLIGAFGLARLIASGMPGLQTNSVPVLISVMLLLTTVALLACWLPARRATKVNPIEALRAE